MWTVHTQVYVLFRNNEKKCKRDAFMAALARLIMHSRNNLRVISMRFVYNSAVRSLFIILLYNLGGSGYVCGS